jgi:hypothetical protein
MFHSRWFSTAVEHIVTLVTEQQRLQAVKIPVFYM